MYLKIYESNVPNAAMSLKNSIEVSKIASKVQDHNISKQINRHINQQPIYAWDFGKKATPYIKKDTEVGILCNNHLYMGQCIDIIFDPRGEIGDLIGWRRQFKNPWENVILIKNVDYRQLNQNEKDILLTKIQSSQKIIRNFYFIDKNILDLKNDDSAKLKSKPDRVVIRKKMIKKQESNFITEKTSLPAPRQDFLYYGFIKELDERIKNLKAIHTHSERDHESLVEFFFKNLGYERPGEIKYQQGRIDVLIEINLKPLFIVEVKKSWEINRFDRNILKQVFNYAFEVGGRYPVITNGDYYAFFDQQKGLSYDDKFVFEFLISKLVTKDLENINSIKKEELNSKEWDIN